ncbi:MAG: hypothetical protein AB1Z23_12260 [Eubacteriales bacterium]
MSTNKKFALKCSVCGNINFEYDEKLYSSITEASKVKCTICNKEYSKKELEDANLNLIREEVIELSKDELKRALKNSGFKIK